MLQPIKKYRKETDTTTCYSLWMRSICVQKKSKIKETFLSHICNNTRMLQQGRLNIGEDKQLKSGKLNVSKN